MKSSRSSLSQRLTEEAQRRSRQHLQRQRISLDPQSSVKGDHGGQTYTLFCSNDYLGLRNHPGLIKALQEGAALYGSGSGASPLITGYSPAHQACEEALADYLGREKVLLCSSGYQANLAVASGLMSRDDLILQDKLNHASLIDAALLSRAKLMRYPHGDTETLTQQLASFPGKAAMIVTDGIFSMDGDQASLEILSSIADKEQAWLAVDDAHAVGVIGPQGRGSVAQAGLGSDRVQVLTGTLGKAFGCFGAFIAGDQALINHLVNQARSYIYSTAMPAAMAYTISKSLELVKQADDRRDKLNQLITYFRDCASQLSLPLLPSSSPIQPLMVGSAAQSLELSQHLLADGLMVSAIRPPTVPVNTSRLRITLSAAHSRSDIDRLLDALQQHWKQVSYG